MLFNYIPCKSSDKNGPCYISQELKQTTKEKTMRTRRINHLNQMQVYNLTLR